MVAPIEDEVHQHHFSAPEGQVDLVAGSTGDTEGCGSGIYRCCSLVTQLKSGMGNMENKPPITIHDPMLWLASARKGSFLLICSLPWCGDGLARSPSAAFCLNAALLEFLWQGLQNNACYQEAI